MSYYMEQLGGATDMHGGKTRWFQDENEPEKLISEAQLKKEYGSNVADGSIDPAANLILVMTMICGKWMRARLKRACFATAASPTWKTLVS